MKWHVSRTVKEVRELPVKEVRELPMHMSKKRMRMEERPVQRP